MLRAKVETITPNMAEKWLAKNDKNRKLRERKVKHLANIIKKDQWKLNGEAIKFSNDGTLLDGQHRLSAIMVSRTPVKSLVVRGLPVEVMPTIDLMSPRICGDHLKMQGFTGAVYSLAAAVGICLNFKRGVYAEMKEKFSPDDMLSFIEANRGLLKSEELYGSDVNLKTLLPPSVSIALHYLFGKTHKKEADLFFYSLTNGEGLGAGSPILKLRNELIARRKDSKRGAWNRKVFIFYVCQAFNLYVQGKRVESLKDFDSKSVAVLPKG